MGHLQTIAGRLKKPWNLLRLLAVTPNASAEDLYSSTAAHARDPAFFIFGGVADTPDGRFDIVALHVYLVLRRLQRDQANDLAQAVFDEFFASLDTALREMGVGDLSVGKRIRGLAEAFYGRAKAYDTALKSHSVPMLQDALRRNLYRNHFVSEAIVSQMADYVEKQNDFLSSQSLMNISSGQLSFVSFQQVS